MPTHAEKRRLPYSPAQLFDLVADIERYPEFLPWCVGCRVTKREGNVVWGDLMVGFKMFRETYTSRVVLDRPGRIDVEYVRGPFRYLNNHWVFLPEADGRECVIDFYIDFEFRSRTLQALGTAVFERAVGAMVNAFEKRAGEVYGEPTQPTGAG